MGYLYRKHQCFTPFIEGNNDIWKCGECGKLWRSHAPGNPDYKYWRPLGWFRRWLLGLKKGK